MEEYWAPDITEWGEHEPDFAAKVDFVHIEAVKELSSSVTAIREQENKAASLLNIVAAILTAASGYLVLNWGSLPTNLRLSVLMLLAGMTISAILLLGSCLRPRAVFFEGNTPDRLLERDQWKYPLSKIKLRDTIDLQEYIDSNRSLSQERAPRLGFAYALVVASPLLSLLIFFLYPP
jgi:hypothetical protein